MRWFLAALAMLVLAGCGDGAATTSPPTTMQSSIAGTTPVLPTQTPVVIVVTATPVPPSPTATSAPAVPLTADEAYLVKTVKGQIGEATILLTWFDDYTRGTVGTAQLEQQANQESDALKGQTQAVIVALQPVADPVYRCFGRVAIDGATTDTIAAGDLVNVAAIRLSQAANSPDATEAQQRASSDLASATRIEDALRAELAGLAHGTPLPNEATQYAVLAGAPYGGIASALGCNPAEGAPAAAQPLEAQQPIASPTLAETPPQPSATAQVPPAPTTSPTLAATAAESTNGNAGRPASPTVPVVACPTTFGISGQSVPPLPAAVSVAGPLPTGGALAYYAGDAFGVLAPAGWACRAAVGADGSQSVSAYPVGSPSASPNGAGGNGGPAVTAGNIPACSGCILDLACPFFTQAAQAQAKDFGQFGIACPRAHVAGEVATPLSATAVAFEDPPGVHGAGQPSGGDLPANGVVLYTPGSPAGAPGPRSYAAARDATCTLPESQHAVCTAILNDFLRRFPVGK